MLVRPAPNRALRDDRIPEVRSDPRTIPVSCDPVRRLERGRPPRGETWSGATLDVARSPKSSSRGRLDREALKSSNSLEPRARVVVTDPSLRVTRCVFGRWKGEPTQ